MASAIATKPNTAINPRATLLVATLSFALITLDTFMVNVALPHIRLDFASGVSGMLWVVNGYTIMFAALMLPAGVLADRLGASRAFSIGLIGFLLAAIVCSVAPSINLLIAGRFVLGSSAAMMLPSSMAMLRDAYPDRKERARAISLWAMGGAGASASGPLIAGGILETGWRWIFVLYIPMCIVMLWMLRQAPVSRHARTTFHLPSQVATCIGMLALVYGMIRGGTDGFAEPWALAAFAVAAVAFTVFGRFQVTVDHPLIPQDVIRSRSAIAAIAVGMGFIVSFYGLVFLMSLYLQDERNLSALQTGSVFVPMALISVAFNAIAARSAERYGIRRMIVFGLSLVIAGLVAIAIIAPNVSTIWIAVAGIPLGVGGSLAMPVATAWLVNSVPDAMVGTASGLLNTFRQACAAMAVAVFGLLITQTRSFEFGMRISMLIGVAALVAAIGAVIWSRRDLNARLTA